MHSSIWILVTLCLLSGCDFRKETRPDSSRSKTISIEVFAAASLSDAFSEIAGTFEEKWPDVDVQLQFAGSQQLAQQLSLGAQADVFASANQMQMDLVVQSGKIRLESPTPFARNRLAVILPPDNPANLETIVDLARPGLLVVLADEVVPIGRYSMILLDNAAQSYAASFKQKVLDNVVSYEQNVRAVLTKVSLGEADAGIVYRSDLIDETSIASLDIPHLINPEAVYPIAPLIDSKHPDYANAFISFILSEEGQLILKRYGFNPMNPA